MINQCDGCQAGIPVINGTHRMGEPEGYANKMACTAKLYEEPKEPTETEQEEEKC